MAIGAFDKEPQQLAQVRAADLPTAPRSTALTLPPHPRQTVLSKTGFRALVAGAALNGDATAVGDALRSRERSVELVRGADVSAVLQDASSAESQALVADLSSFGAWQRWSRAGHPEAASRPPAALTAASDAVDTAMVLCEEYGEESYVAVVATKSAASAPTVRGADPLLRPPPPTPTRPRSPPRAAFLIHHPQRSLLTTVGATSSDNEYIRITPEILAGLVLSFFLILIAFTGIYYLLGIQTPSKLPTDPPTVGREY